MQERRYCVTACVGTGLFETIQSFDTKSAKSEAMKMYAFQITHRDWIETEEGNILFCKHILYLR